jgi:hypothetical protein
MADLDPLHRFLQQVAHAFASAQWQKLLLSSYQGADPERERVLIQPVQIKQQLLLRWVFQNKTFDITQNYDLAQSQQQLLALLGAEFRSAVLHSGGYIYQLGFSKKGKPLLNRHRDTSVPANSANTSSQAASSATTIASKGQTSADNVSAMQAPTAGDTLDQLATAHNRQKQRFIAQQQPYLKALGITDTSGQIVPSMSKKWKQINKFIEIFAGAMKQAKITDRPLTVADFGSGKAYLTFAMHDYLQQQGLCGEVIGVELRPALVNLCNGLAAQLKLENLQFEQGDVQHFAARGIDVMVALHACDVATDYAIHMGINVGAPVIMCSPCCHKELRPQLKAPQVLAPLLNHGIHAGQQAEMLTDGLRALLLEAHGYDTQVFEFIGLEHTSKNKMILAIKRAQPRDTRAIWQQIDALMAHFSISQQRLYDLLLPASASRLESTT